MNAVILEDQREARVIVDEKHVIVWDLGATKCAAGLVAINPCTKQISCRGSCAVNLQGIASLESLISCLEGLLNFKHVDADAICIGAAGIFDGNILYLDKGYPLNLP